MEKLGSAGLPAVLAINKIDMVEPAALLPVIESFSCTYHFEAIIPVSALRGDGLEELTGTLIELLPSGPALYAEDDLSDLPTRFFVAEIVREQVTRLTGREIPYKTAVVVGAFKEGRGAVVIQAEIHVERESQKKIMIGRKGGMLKRIGTESRRKIEHFLDCPVRLELFVKVTPHWTRDPARLEEFGYI
jgi:GTP-binding protein Era